VAINSIWRNITGQSSKALTIDLYTLYDMHLNTLLILIFIQLFRAEVRIVDHAKKAVLQKSLLQHITSTTSSEKLDEKLAPLRSAAPDISNRTFFENSA
jgi:hypothetical protein